jgi:hypothetical protein
VLIITVVLVVGMVVRGMLGVIRWVYLIYDQVALFCLYINFLLLLLFILTILLCLPVCLPFPIVKSIFIRVCSTRITAVTVAVCIFVTIFLLVYIPILSGVLPLLDVNVGAVAIHICIYTQIACLLRQSRGQGCAPAFCFHVHALPNMVARVVLVAENIGCLD